MMEIFYFLRHGSTKYNHKGQIISFTDCSLSKLGKQQAALAKKIIDRLPIKKIYSSPYLRAYETAAIINQSHHLPLILENDLREQNLGKWELKPVPFFLEKYQRNETPEDGESFDHLYTRIETVLYKILRGKHQPCLIVGHYGFFYTLLNRLKLKTQVDHCKNCMIIKVYKNEKNEWCGEVVCPEK